MQYDVTIGLEVHCQLNTSSKIFATDSTLFGSDANTNVNVLTLAHPGVLPMLNASVVDAAIQLGLVCGCEINTFNFFDRKNYFYPDLPKGYQISQDREPICIGGNVSFKVRSGKTFSTHSVKIHHIHMEEDAGKSIHDIDPVNTLLDYNRAGTPLLEIVSEPCISSPEEAAGYLNEIRKIVRFLGISDGNMEEGSLRADLNVSLKPQGSSTLGTKVEIKNMNSIRYLQKAAEYEIERQSDLLSRGIPIVQETRGFDPDTGKTTSLRVKETMNDYKYFPEPDLAPIVITHEKLDDYRKNLPLLPLDVFEILVNKHGLSEDNAYLLSEEKDLSDYYFKTLEVYSNPRSIANWILSQIKGYLNEKGLDMAAYPILPSQTGELLEAIESGKISHSAAQKLMLLLIDTPHYNIMELAASNNLLLVSDSNELEKWVDEVLTNHADKVQEYKKGKKGLIGLFVGEVMKLSKGSGDPKLINELLIKKLN
ncbi:MAG: Asp-tRNA(Asn)/Glu-tRNA(Gln) amidotransferase subunit GatB [Leadbetterella sp.]